MTAFGSRLCENAPEPRTLRIVFSIALCQQHLPVRLVSAATKSRWKFYVQVQCPSFHTGWVNRVILTLGRSLPVYPTSDISVHGTKRRDVPTADKAATCTQSLHGLTR
jgi:hypothetical protein